ICDRLELPFLAAFADEQEDHVAIPQPIGGADHGLEVLSQSEIAGIQNDELPFETLLTDEGILGLGQRADERLVHPIVDHPNAIADPRMIAAFLREELLGSFP